jgi:hypothetical protein
MSNSQPPRFVYEKTAEELYEALNRQILNLRRSISAYDEGATEEAERMAASIFIMLHEGSKNRALLLSLGLRKTMVFPDSSFILLPSHPGGEVMQAPPLCVIQMVENSVQYAPLCIMDTPEEPLPVKWVSFERWWEQGIYTTARDRELSRKNVVFAMRNHDGGAHVGDKSYHEAYHWLATDFDPRVRVTNGEGMKLPLKNAHWPTMRQVAWEVDRALTMAAIE